MSKIHEVPPNELIAKLAEELKGIEAIKAPEWSAYVKTGVHKERRPVADDWWYTRAAALLRFVHLRGPVGVSKIRTRYGGKKDRGHKTEHFYKGSGSIARKLLQQMEKAGLMKQVKKGVHHGRITTGKAHALLDHAGFAVRKTLPVEEMDVTIAVEKKVEGKKETAAKEEHKAAEKEIKLPQKEAKEEASIPQLQQKETAAATTKKQHAAKEPQQRKEKETTAVKEEKTAVKEQQQKEAAAETIEESQ